MKFLELGVDALSPECELPVCEAAGKFIDVGIPDDNCPFPNAGFSPIKMLVSYIY